jgi:hypothetical protein
MIRTLAFAAPDSSFWGATWIPDGDHSAQLACRAGGGGDVLAARMRGETHADQWRIEAEQVSLTFTPAGPTARGGLEDDGLNSIDQLCAVSGTLGFEGSERDISCTGWRSILETRVELEGIDSFRQAAGWLDADQGLALLALRRRNSRAHDTDLIAAAVLERDMTPRVADPRLSTTYDAAGLPTRVGLELWLEPDEEAEPVDDEAERHLSRRAAGEAIGSGVDWELAGFKLHAALLRWHSRGHDGTGVYLLGRRG